MRETSSFVQRSNLEFLEQMYQDYKANPAAVDPSWQMFFEGMEFGAQRTPTTTTSAGALKEIQVYNLLEHYRNYGHLKAKLDPLDMQETDDSSFQLENFGLTAKDLEQTFAVGALLGKPQAKLKDLILHLEQTYCRTLSTQVSECRPEVRDWFRKKMETEPTHPQMKTEEKVQVFEQLARTESLEKFIHTRYVGTKRFSIEGGDALIPMLERLVTQGTPLGVEELVIGMAHRGRINVLANFMDKAIDVIFSEFDGTAFEQFDFDGDVKYHLGYSTDKKTPNGNCHVSLAFNPSHLEVVNPVVLGMTRAKQRRRNDTMERKKVLPVQIHGDAAFAGQGVVTETLQLSLLKGYTVGGSIHIIINNQVGFTTDPKDSRSCRYASDTGKVIKAPSILVNGDDVLACIRAMDLAVQFRQQFGEDVVIDLICYRRFGHNEGDEPAFTQPKMYEKIKTHPTLMKIYSEQVLQEGVMKPEQVEGFYKQKIDNLQKILDDTRKTPPTIKVNAFEGQWKGLRRGKLEDFDKPVNTACSAKDFDKVAKILTTEPQGFHVHPKISKLIQARAEMVKAGKLDWAMGELLAYGTLCVEGTPVRLSGQDCKRGTFTHRQAVYFDTETGEEYCPLATLNPDKGEFVVYNSSLSEMAVLGFEYGNSCSDPHFMTIWEAQFGDFANGAQIVIDQFLSSSEEKWSRGSGLTLLLPHGYEGQGPEHSSARLERFLQLCAQANLQVCNFTTPANLFHALRRQMKRDFRKPLIIMSPKSLLRHPKVISPIEDFTKGLFQEVITDPKKLDPKKIETLVLCSGKLYYELDAAREDKFKRDDLTIVRVEQLYPFPKVGLTEHLNGYPKLKKIIWAQEEPQNMGAWQYIRPKIEELMSDLGKTKIELEYVGRTERASPATGSPKAHTREQNAIIQQSLS